MCLIFHVFQVSQLIPGPRVYLSYFSPFLTLSHNISGPTMSFSNFPRFSGFLDIFQFLQCEFLICICQFSCHMSCPTVYIYHFSRFSVFLAIFQDLPCEILIFNVCQFSHNIPGPTVCVTHFPGYLTFIAICQVLQCVFIIFYVFQCFSPYSRSYYVRFSISSFVSFPRHISHPKVCISHFP